MDRTREEKMAIANEILKQLGGHKFVVMTGAKDILALDSGLRFRLPGGGGHAKNGINQVRIELTPTDTYEIYFQKVRKDKVWTSLTETISKHANIYDDQLQNIFTAETGLETHL